MEKNEITTRSFALFKQYGLKNVSMDRIATELGVSKKTLYVHFANKEELIQRGVQEVSDALFDDFDRIISLERHPLVKLSLVLHILLAEIIRYDQAYFYTVRRYSSAVLQDIERLRQRIMACYLKPLLGEAHALGCFQEELRLDLFAEVALARIDEKISHLVETGLAPSLSDCYYHLIVYPIHGICTRDCATRYLAAVKEEIGTRAK